MERVDVLLVGQDRLLREGLKQILLDTQFAVEADVDSVELAEEKLKAGLKVGLLLIDCPYGSIPASYASLRNLAPDICIVVLAVMADRTALVNALDAGINAILLKNISAEALKRSLSLAMLGEQVVAVHAALLRDIPEATGERDVVSDSNGHHLSIRELNILRCLTAGQSNKMIARELTLSEATVKAHVKLILRKINARNRTQAAIWGLANIQGNRGAIAPV